MSAFVVTLYAEVDPAIIEKRDAEIRKNLEIFTKVDIKKLPESGKAAPFNIKLNGASSFTYEGKRYSGFRFVVKRDQEKDKAPQDLVWFFISPKDSGFNGWYITGSKKSLEKGFTYFMTYSTGGLPENWLPKEKKFIYYQTLSGHKLTEGEEYIMWFSFKHDDVKEYEITAAIGYMADGYSDIAARTHLGL